MASFWLLYTVFDVPDQGELHSSESGALARALRLHKSQEGFQFVCIRDEKKKVIVDPEQFNLLLKDQEK